MESKYFVSKDSILSKEQKHKKEENSSFLCEIVDTFSLKDRRIIVAGTVKQGTVHVGDEIQIKGINGVVIYTTVKKMEVYGGFVDEVTSGMNVGFLLGEEVTKENVKKGQLITLKEKVKTAQNFNANIYLSSESERNKNSFFLKSEDTANTFFD